MATNTKQPAPLLTRQQAAASLGVALRTLDTLAAKGELPFVKIGRAVRFRPSALESFVDANETRPASRRHVRSK